MIRKVEKKFPYEFNKYVNYIELLIQLPEFYPNIWDKCQITFFILDQYSNRLDNHSLEVLKYANDANSISAANAYDNMCASECSSHTYIQVKDLHKNLSHGDKIIIRINEGTNRYFLSAQNIKLYSSHSLKIIYEYYYTVIKFLTNAEVLVYKEDENGKKLVDVLQDDKHFLNECINRLIHNYNY